LKFEQDTRNWIVSHRFWTIHNTVVTRM